MSTFLTRSFSTSQDALRATNSVGDAFRDERCAINDQRVAHALSCEIIATMASRTDVLLRTLSREKRITDEKCDRDPLRREGSAADTLWIARAAHVAGVARYPQRDRVASTPVPFRFFKHTEPEIAPLGQRRDPRFTSWSASKPLPKLVV
jgi:hypothetical protein